MFSDAERADLATYIANLPNPTPILTHVPFPGPVFPPTSVGASVTQTVTVTNSGTAPLIFATNGAATIASGPFSADFTVSASQAASFCQGVTLQPNAGSCTVAVQFRPASRRILHAERVASACDDDRSQCNAGVGVGQFARRACPRHNPATDGSTADRLGQFAVQRRRGTAMADRGLAAAGVDSSSSPVVHGVGQAARRSDSSRAAARNVLRLTPGHETPTIPD